MMDHGFTPEQTMIRDLARQIAKEKVAPHVTHHDETGEFPAELVKALAEADLFGIVIPEEFGGTNGGTLATALVVEELSRQCGAVAFTYSESVLGSIPLILAGNAGQKTKYLPRVAKGETLCSFALSEPEIGADLANVRTTAAANANGYVLNGVKQAAANAPEAQVYIVFARTAEGANGISAFIVEKGAKGLNFGKRYSKTGFCATSSCDLTLENCVVPKENLLGNLNEGALIAQKTMDRAKALTAALAVGIAQGSMEASLHYSTERKQFDAPICEFQALQFMMAKMATNIETARAMTYAVCRMIDSGLEGFGPHASMAKIFASDAAMSAAIDGVQILGGYGYIKEYPVEKRMRDAKMTQIGSGTNEMQKMGIARYLLKEYCGYDAKPLG